MLTAGEHRSTIRDLLVTATRNPGQTLWLRASLTHEREARPADRVDYPAKAASKTASMSLLQTEL
jgi:hypothetical protein